jgi:hypothetical protein
MKLFSMLRYKNMGEVGCLKDGNFQNLEATDVNVTNLTISGRLNTNLTTHYLSVDGVDGVTAITGTTAATPTGQTFLPNTLNIFDVTRTATDVYGFQLPTLASTSPGDVIRVLVTKITGGTPATSIYHINVSSLTDKILGSVVARYEDPTAFVANVTGTLADFRGKDQSCLVYPSTVATAGAGQIIFQTGVIHKGGGQVGTDITLVNRNGAFWEIGGRVIMGVGDFAHQPVTSGTIFAA